MGLARSPISFRRSEFRNLMPRTSAQADAARIHGTGWRWRSWWAFWRTPFDDNDPSEQTEPPATPQFPKNPRKLALAFHPTQE